MKNKEERTGQAHERSPLDEWDVITATTDGGVVWRRYGDGKIVVGRIGEHPDQALARAERGEASGDPKPTYARGDYVKVEFTDEATGIGERMWLRVDRCDDKKRIVYGTLDSEPLNDYGGQLHLGSKLAVSFAQIREHRKAA